MKAAIIQYILIESLLSSLGTQLPSFQFFTLRGIRVVKVLNHGGIWTINGGNKCKPLLKPTFKLSLSLLIGVGCVSFACWKFSCLFVDRLLRSTVLFGPVGA